MRAKDRTGLDGEERAAEYLEAAGHTILARRWRSRAGELDLITAHEGELVAVEVKTRRGVGYGHPFEAVTPQKLHRLHRLIAEYAAAEGMWPARRRVDVVSVVLSRHSAREQLVEIDWLRDQRP